MKLAEGFGNYLYIIFAVVYVIYSIIKAGKKVTQNRPTIDKQPQSSPTVQPSEASPIPEHNSGDELKKMLEDLLGGGGQEYIPEKPVIPSRQQPEVEKPFRKEPVAVQPVKIKTPAYGKEKKIAITAKPKEATVAFVAHPEIVQQVFSELPDEEEGGIDFDIRQAIIHSEILKRPQY